MLFQSLDFAIFLPIVLAAYWLLRGRTGAQNVVIAAASVVFYAFAGWRLLGPLAVGTLVAYGAAILIDRSVTERARNSWVVAGVAVNLGLLAYFKYANFFIDSFNAELSVFGARFHAQSLHVVLPVGISFYTFRTISYIVDVGRGDTPVDRSIIRVFTFVAFFPYLLAGPVERSKRFLPQLLEQRFVTRGDIDAAARLILWGLFKKIVIADALANDVDYIFVNHADVTGSTLAIGVVYYTLQLYADFSGYSDIAVGVAKLFGFRITQNFHTPFFARSIADFWRRWHISLYDWLADYLFGPLSLALRDFGLAGIVAAVIATFTLSGLWHGAGWGFVVWGLLHGLYFVPLILMPRAKGRKSAKGVKGGSGGRNRAIIGGHGGAVIHARDAGWILLTFSCVVFANVFFRSATITDAFSYLRHLVSPSIFAPTSLPLGKLAWVLVLPAFEWMQRNRAHALDVADWPYTIRYPLYGALCLAIFVSIRPTNSPEFLYFKY